MSWSSIVLESEISIPSLNWVIYRLFFDISSKFLSILITSNDEWKTKVSISFV